MIRILAWIGGCVALLALLLFGVPNTGMGRHLMERGIAWISGGEITVQGLGGRFPDALRAARVNIRDADGPWLQLDNVTLDWSPFRLTSREVSIVRLAAARATVARLPATSGGGSTPSSLPVRVQIDALHIDRLELAPPVGGVAAALSADGSARLDFLETGTAELTLRRLDTAGLYHLSGRLNASTLAAQLHVEEPPQGLVAHLVGLPDLGATAMTAEVNGPKSSLATHLSMTAGPLHAAAEGTVDTLQQTLSLDLTATAPAMTPRPDLSWQGMTLLAHVTGPFDRLTGTGSLRISALAAAGFALQAIVADVSGDQGHVTLQATIDGLRIPGANPELLMAAPMMLQAHADLTAPDRPITLELSHPLFDAKGLVHAGSLPDADVTLTTSDLAGFASAMQGHAQLRMQAAMTGNDTRLQLSGTFGLTDGTSPFATMVGPDATLRATATLHGNDIAQAQLHLVGRSLSVDATGSMTDGMVDVVPTIALADLSQITPALSGAVQAKGHVAGRQDDLTADVDLSGKIATRGFPLAPVTASLQMRGLPNMLAGQMTAAATLAGAPLTIAATLGRSTDGALHLSVGHADWNSAHMEAELMLAPGAALPQGHAALRMTNLAELRPLVDQAISGSIDATMNVDDQQRAKLQIDARHVGPVDTINLSADGPPDAVGLRLTASGAGVQTTASAALNADTRRLALSTLQATWQSQRLTLLAPAQLDFNNDVSIDHLRLGLGRAELNLSGRVAPVMNVTATLSNLPADLATLFMPDTRLDGLVQAEAKLQGTLANPSGTVKVTAAGLHLRTGLAAGLPPVSSTITAALANGRARLNAQAALGTTHLTLVGTAPLDTQGTLDLTTQAGLDLQLLDPLLAADGRQMRGHVTLDAGIAGRIGAPEVNGTARLAGGEIQDFARGVRIRNVEAVIRAAGGTVRIERFSGTAGSGTITTAGTLGLAAPMPLDLTLTARNAALLSSDLLTATLDANLRLQGEVLGALTASGDITIQHADVRIPERLPAGVAVLNVRRPGQPAAPPPARETDIGMNVTLKAQHVFVRGRGVDAEMEGTLRLGGSTVVLQPNGGLTLRRGQFSLVGQSLTFSAGRIGLDGGGRLDPTLNFTASTASADTVATLLITGYASAPKITLSSMPTLPPDEVLARLLFGRSLASLGPLEVAQIAAGLAQIAGVGGGAQPLEAIRARLGLDRLSVGSSPGGQGGTVQAGRYVAPGVYVGAKQGTGGAGTQATVQIDLWRNLKLETSVGSSSATPPPAGTSDSGGTNIGLTWQFQY